MRFKLKQIHPAALVGFSILNLFSVVPYINLSSFINVRGIMAEREENVIQNLRAKLLLKIIIDQ